MQNAMSASLRTIIFFASVFSICGCNSLLLTTPLCGPNSMDQRPVSPIPEAAVGCYEVPAVSTTTIRSGNVFASNTTERAYVWVSKDGFNSEIAVPGSAETLLKSFMADSKTMPICDVPRKNANPNSRVIMSYEKGWNSMQEYTFDTVRNVVTIGSYDISAERIKKSGLQYAVFPQKNGGGSEKTPIYPIREILDSSISAILIDNSQITPEALFERLQIERNKVVFEFPKVDPRKCMTAGMTKISL